MVPDRSASVSKYAIDKFLFMIDRDHDLVERYRDDPVGTVAWWESEQANLLPGGASVDSSTWISFTDGERAALQSQDLVALYEFGAHPLITLTLWIAMFERDFPEPLSMQRDYARQLAHLKQAPNPDIST